MSSRSVLRPAWLVALAAVCGAACGAGSHSPAPAPETSATGGRAGGAGGGGQMGGAGGLATGGSASAAGGADAAAGAGSGGADAAVSVDVPAEADASEAAPDAGAPVDSAVAGDAAGLAGAVTGARENLEWLVSTVWSGTRRTVALEGAAKIFTAGFEAGKFGGNGNGHIIRLPISPGREYVFEYRLRFDAGYDFSRGGKIPGLGGGNAPSGCETSTGVGFTARQMWRENGRLIGYVYDMDQRGDCGNNLETGFNFQVGQWYRVKQRIKLNTGTQHNGILQLWIDDKLVLDRSNMGWMGEAPDRRIDRIFLDFFFGGSTADWSPRRNCSLSFTDLFLTRVVE